MKKIFPVFTILVVIFTMNARHLMSQSYKLHAEYRTDWYGAGYDMLQDIPGYPSVILQAELSANQYVIESDNDANKWRQFGTTTYNQASLFLWYNSPVSDNELADSTTQNKWYTTRIKDAGYTSTEGIVMETTNEPTQFAAVNTIVQTTPNPVYTNQNINFTVNMAGPRSPEEFCFMRYSYDNFVTSDIVIVFFSGLNDLTGNATISATATEKTVQVYAFTSTYDAWNFPASDFDLITLRRGLNNGNTVSVTTFDPPSASTVRFRVDMKNVTPGPNGPHVVGSFNNWDSTTTPMTQGVGSLWFADVVVDTNDILQYRFLGDDTYAAQETVPNACGVDDGFGVYNRKLNVPNVANTTLPVVCFSSCAACVYPDTVLVTFRVDVGGPAPNGVSVFGSWDNYAGTALGLIGGTTWGAAIKLDTTTQVLYYYKKGTLAENFYGNCTKPNGLGGNYRFLNVPEANTVLNIVCFNNCQNCANNNKVTVTFRVDMTGTPLGPGNAHVVGNFNNFNPFATLFYPKGNGIYEATALIDTTQVIYYKFLRDASFTGEEKVPEACGVFYGAWGDTLRKLTIPENDTLLDVVCYSSCIACQPTSLVEITFRVDMNIVPVGPGGVHMAGNFNGWNTTQIPMTQEGSTTIYRCVLKLDTAIRIKFTYFSDTTLASHENIPSNCGHGGNGQNFQGREYDVDQVSTVLLPVCFGYCSCNNVGKVKVRFRVDMANTTIGNSYAHIVGTFNNFDPTATIIFPVNGTIYIQDVLLDTNTTYQYKFLRDANFIGAEVVPSACGVPDGNGGYLREVYIGYQDTMIKAVCYGGCSGACPPNSQKEITFKVDMSNTTIGPGGPHVIGNFNNYDVTATPMIDGGNGLYYSAVFVDTSQTIIYKFLKDSSLVDQEQVPVACNDANDFRQVYMGNTGQIVPTVCYGSCTTCKQGQTADVTFRVDVGQSGFGSGVYLATSDNGFNPLQMNSLGGSVYSLTLNLDTTLSLDYYFINNLGPGGDEIVPSACGVLNGFGNYYRHLEVPESPLLLPNVCFGECVLCPPPPLSDVTFQVNVSNTNIGANAMYLAGDFNSWNTTSLLMTNYGNGIWKRTVTLDTTKTIQYRFFVGNTFAGSETVNSACGITDTVGGLSRQLEVPETDVILPAVCLNECANCPANVNVTFRCNLAQTTIGAGKPHLAGTFNGWSLTATPMDSIGNSIYEKTLTLDSTLTYEYKFLSDTLTTAYEIVPNACGINNGGVYNRKLIAPEVTTVLPAVCYASCNPCVFPDSVDITFKVDLSLVTLGNGGPHLVGSFNNWNANKNPLSQITGNIWGTTLRLDTTEVIEYKFTTDNNIASQELVPVLCGTPNVFYGLVRKLIVPQVDSTLTTVCFSSCVACPLPVTANVRFRVNMLQTTIGAGKPHLAGTFNGWSNTLTPLDSIGNGIYEVTLQLDTTSTIQYKFLNDTTFNTVETVPVLCGVSDGFGGFNRSLAIPESDILLPTVCYSACTDCVFPDSVDVTFQVDLAQVTLGPGGPHLVGNFNGFDVKATPLANVTGTIYAATLRLDTMLNAEYKFLVDTSYINEEFVPQACGISNGFGGYNRLTFVPENDTVLPVVCYSSCAACVVPDSVDVTFQVDLAQVTLGQGGPHLVGSFNSFDVKATPLANVTGTIYAATVRIDTTANVEYKFLVDTSYINEETVPQACGVPNGFGGYNRFLSVPENDTVLSVVCYSGCSACVVPDSVDVTFQVDLAQVTLGQGGPHLVGTFNGFDVKATPLANVTGTIYAATVRIDTTSNVEYKFLVDTSYINEETVPQACGVPNGFGGYNRFLSVPENDTVLSVVCYSGCAGCVFAR
nr:hypothetical protein [Bacteroidota bacterium]